VSHTHDAGSLAGFRELRERMNAESISYHLVRCREEGVRRDEIFESFSVALIVGGSIVIPHLRRAVARWSELEQLPPQPADQPRG